MTTGGKCCSSLVLNPDIEHGQIHTLASGPRFLFSRWPSDLAGAVGNVKRCLPLAVPGPLAVVRGAFSEDEAPAGGARDHAGRGQPGERVENDMLGVGIHFDKRLVSGAFPGKGIARRPCRPAGCPFCKEKRRLVEASGVTLPRAV